MTFDILSVRGPLDVDNLNLLTLSQRHRVTFENSKLVDFTDFGYAKVLTCYCCSALWWLDSYIIFPGLGQLRCCDYFQSPVHHIVHFQSFWYKSFLEITTPVSAFGWISTNPINGKPIYIVMVWIFLIPMIPILQYSIQFLQYLLS